MEQSQLEPMLLQEQAMHAAYMFWQRIRQGDRAPLSPAGITSTKDSRQHNWADVNAARTPGNGIARCSSVSQSPQPP